MDRATGIHVFLNLEQEYDSVRQSLAVTESKDPRLGLATEALHSSYPSPKPVESGMDDTPHFQSHPSNVHIRNLNLLQQVLALLPPTSSALLTTPEEAAHSGQPASTTFEANEVGTRRKKNPLIHSLLTDKPVFSSSLPTGRIGSVPETKESRSVTSAKLPPTTFAKRGMPLTIFPDPRVSAWTAANPGNMPLTLNDPRIDLARLVHLIEDSFSRKLDVKHYISRVNDRIAGVIIAGEYEGGAILTWETPPGVEDDGSEESRRRMVPYLDKFAVLKKSQGAGGVADIVFKSMVRDCFPEGVCWRSRRDNPVNKWYFERARGTWKLPGTNWTMFWTTGDLAADSQLFLDYEGVCSTVVPSWADRSIVQD
jgi:amino-acid N-acetyltransferase